MFSTVAVFHSALFGVASSQRTLGLPLGQITSIQRARTMGLPNAIELVCAGRKRAFTSFLRREDAFNTLTRAWAEVSPYGRLAGVGIGDPRENEPSHGRQRRQRKPSTSSPDSHASRHDADGDADNHDDGHAVNFTTPIGDGTGQGVMPSPWGPGEGEDTLPSTDSGLTSTSNKVTPDPASAVNSTQSEVFEDPQECPVARAARGALGTASLVAAALGLRGGRGLDDVCDNEMDPMAGVPVPLPLPQKRGSDLLRGVSDSGAVSGQGHYAVKSDGRRLSRARSESVNVINSHAKGGFDDNDENTSDVATELFSADPSRDDDALPTKPPPWALNGADPSKERVLAWPLLRGDPGVPPPLPNGADPSLAMEPVLCGSTCADDLPPEGNKRAARLPDTAGGGKEDLIPLTLEEFATRCLSDNGSGGPVGEGPAAGDPWWPRHHVGLGHTDVRCSPWRWDRAVHSLRQLEFSAPSKGPIGPAFTRCIAVQRCRAFADRGHWWAAKPSDVSQLGAKLGDDRDQRNAAIVLCAEQRMLDVPFGDAFRVETRWTFAEARGRGCRGLAARCWVRVVFERPVWVRGAIETGVKTETRKSACSMIDEIRAEARLMHANEENESEPLSGAEDEASEDASEAEARRAEEEATARFIASLPAAKRAMARRMLGRDDSGGRSGRGRLESTTSRVAVSPLFAPEKWVDAAHRTFALWTGGVPPEAPSASASLSRSEGKARGLNRAVGVKQRPAGPRTRMGARLAVPSLAMPPLAGGRWNPLPSWWVRVKTPRTNLSWLTPRLAAAGSAGAERLRFHVSFLLVVCLVQTVAILWLLGLRIRIGTAPGSVLGSAHAVGLWGVGGAADGGQAAAVEAIAALVAQGDETTLRVLVTALARAL